MPHFVWSIHYCGSALVQLQTSRSARLLITHSPNTSSTSGEHPRGGADMEAGMPSDLPENATCIQNSIVSWNSQDLKCSSSLSEPKCPSFKPLQSEWLGSLSAWRAKSREWYQQSHNCAQRSLGLGGADAVHTSAGKYIVGGPACR